MMTSPTIDDLLEGVILGIQDELVPNLVGPKAQAMASMMQSILQGVRQLLPVYNEYLIDEHNAMTRTLQAAAANLAGVGGPEADRIRASASGVGQLADIATLPDMDVVKSQHRSLTAAFETAIADLDVLQRAGGPEADAANEALNTLRAHLGPRYVRDTETFIIAGSGMIGRG